MGRTQKLAATCLWAVLVIGMTAVVASGVWTKQGSGLPVLFDAPAFALVNQDARPVADTDLRGQPYVAAFIFTHCAGICPMMSAKMARLQKAIPDPRVKLVSFTVDPERDTPEVLKAYSDKLGADNARWYFLTGTRHQISDVVTGMKIGTGDTPLDHSERFVLVDGDGRVRATYLSSEDGAMERLAADAEKLAGAGR